MSRDARHVFPTPESLQNQPGWHALSERRAWVTTTPFSDVQGVTRCLDILIVARVRSFLFFHHLGDRDLWSSHEGRAGQNAADDAVARPLGLARQCDFRPEMQKPPLYYWLVAGLAWLRGGSVRCGRGAVAGGARGTGNGIGAFISSGSGAGGRWPACSPE